MPLLHAEQSTSPAEGRVEKGHDGDREGGREVAQVVRRLYSLTHSTDGSGNRVVASCGDDTDKRGGEEMRRKRHGVINHVSDALTHS